MAMKRSGAGGGPNSNKNVSPGYRHGRVAMEKRVEGVSRIGQSVGNRATGMTGKMRNVEDVRGSKTPISGELGNRLAERTVCKPGGSRDVTKTGTQGCY
jgi:hypothetical protein